MSSSNKALLFALCLVLFTVSFLITVGIKVWLNKQTNPISTTTTPSSQSSPTTFSPQPRNYPLEPPGQSTVGKVTAVTGEAEKQPRDQDEAIVAVPDLHIRESERMTTQADATLTMAFPDAFNIKAEEETVIAFISTNPAHFLVRQDRGTATYTTDQKIPTVSIRFLRGLFSMTDGEVSVTTDPIDDIATFSVSKGTGTFGYINNNNNQTQIVEVKAGENLTFNSPSRSVRLQ